jgi:hypothetical protein
MSDRVGDWMQTYTGRVFYPLDPRPEDVDIIDVAHSLSLQCRFAGHCRFHYSVAQHCLLVARLVPPEQALAALLHDAAEAYLVDLPRPIKRSPGVGPAYLEAEARVERVVRERFGLPAELTPEIHRADAMALMTEKRDVMGPSPRPWVEDLEPDPIVIVSTPPHVVENMFFDAFYALTGD